MKEDTLIRIVGKVADKLSDGQVIAITLIGMVLGLVINAMIWP